jgi:hypothetical protein
MLFESPKEAQTYLDHWEERWADTRIHGTTKRQVAANRSNSAPVSLSEPSTSAHSANGKLLVTSVEPARSAG